jgi:hypothetical protein
LIQRHGKQVSEAAGLKDGKKRSIIFRHNVDVLAGDWLVDTQTEARFFVTDVDHAKDHSGQPVHVRVLYETRLAYERQESISQMVNQLDDIADAIWPLSDEDAPPEKKRVAQVALDEIKNFVRGLPPGAAVEIGSRMLGG